jgi:adenylate cyclase
MEERRLAAIMFTDIVGYTALMDENEEQTFQILEKNRKIHKVFIKKYRGKWLKEMGDGVLASFHTITDAVCCAIEIQETCKREPDLKLRIGIHQGEVTFQGEDVFGSGVNIASRLEELAPIGGIYISESVFRNVQNKEGIKADFVREETLKNVKHPIKIFEVELEGDLIPSNQRGRRRILMNNPFLLIASIIILLVVAGLIWVKFSSGSKKKIDPGLEKSIALLPFKNLSADEVNQYFCDGVMEGILNNLSQIKDLRVLSRSSTDKYHESTPPSPQIAEELNVNYLVEASVFKSEDRVRITAQLIDARNDEHIWSKQYDREIQDIFNVMSDVSKEVASEIEVTISPEVKDRIELIPTENTEAYNLYLQGLYFWNKRNGEAVKKGIEFFKEAIKEDSSFAIAYSGLADAYNISAAWRFILPSEGYEKAKAAALHALEINHSLGQAYAALAFEQLYYEFDREHANENFKEAIRLNPNYAPAHQWHSQLYDFIGNRNDALIEIQKAMELDPLSLIINNGYVLHNFWNGDYEKAVELSKNVQTIDPDFAPAHYVLYQCYYQLKKFDLAYKHFKFWLSTYGFDVGMIEKEYLESGWQGMTRKMIDISLQNKDKFQFSPGRIAEYYVYLNEKEKALDYLENAFDERDSIIPSIKIDPIWQPLHDEPRFQNIINKMDFP